MCKMKRYKRFGFEKASFMLAESFLTSRKYLEARFDSTLPGKICGITSKAAHDCSFTK